MNRLLEYIKENKERVVKGVIVGISIVAGSILTVVTIKADENDYTVLEDEPQPYEADPILDID